MTGPRACVVSAQFIVSANKHHSLNVDDVKQRKRKWKAQTGRVGDDDDANTIAAVKGSASTPVLTRWTIRPMTGVGTMNTVLVSWLERHGS